MCSPHHPITLYGAPSPFTIANKSDQNIKKRASINGIKLTNGGSLIKLVMIRGWLSKWAGIILAEFYYTLFLSILNPMVSLCLSVFVLVFFFVLVFVLLCHSLLQEWRYRLCPLNNESSCDIVCVCVCICLCLCLCLCSCSCLCVSASQTLSSQ